MRTLLVSDIHLGSTISRAECLLKLLRQTETDRIILLGDVFTDLNLRRLQTVHLLLLLEIRLLINKGVEVVWIEGNHDAGLITLLSHLAGIKAYEEYEWGWAGHRCLAIHGHQFDSIVSGHKLISWLASSLFVQAQRVPFLRRRILSLIDLMTTRWQRLTPAVSRGALNLGAGRHCDFVFCGHTHEVYMEKQGRVTYVNTGCWVGERASYILLDGSLEVYEFGWDGTSKCVIRLHP
jgi:UDP-2,3-diacylglucosamine pyrophosphatase LpxH